MKIVKLDEAHFTGSDTHFYNHYGQHVLFVPEAVDMKVDGTIIYTTKDVKVNDSKDTATTIEGNNYIIYEEQ